MLILPSVSGTYHIAWKTFFFFYFFAYAEQYLQVLSFPCLYRKLLHSSYFHVKEEYQPPICLMYGMLPEDNTAISIWLKSSPSQFKMKLWYTLTAAHCRCSLAKVSWLPHQHNFLNWSKILKKNKRDVQSGYSYSSIHRLRSHIQRHLRLDDLD